MPCYHPLQASFAVFKDGSRKAFFPKHLSDKFRRGEKLPEGCCCTPCGRCMGCRLERSRQWAVRCLHESKLYDENCFITLTFDEDYLSKMCPNGSLVRKHTQDFMKRLRKKFEDRTIRVFGCGEYGDESNRPHYHFCLFNCEFKDRIKWKRSGDFWLYNSDVLSKLWPFGHAVVCDFSFETAAYVGRYCTKKICGPGAEKHYGGRLPEFPVYSNRPGIGRGWIDEFGKSDVFSYDECIVNGMRSKPPRYYDKVRELSDPDGAKSAKLKRTERALDRAEDNSYRRLLVKEKCCEARFKKLIRIIER